MLKVLPTVSTNTAIAIFRVDNSDMEKAMVYADLRKEIEKGDGDWSVNEMSLLKANSWHGCGVYIKKQRSNLRFVSLYQPFKLMFS
jgi:hypothetical protein